MEKIIMDRKTIKVLASDTRREILKHLSKSQLTLTDVAKIMNMSASTIKEHMDEMVSAGMIIQKDEGRKWKYYVLTNRGREITSPNEKRIYLLLGMAALAVIFTGYRFLSYFGTGMSNSAMKSDMLYAPAAESSRALGDASANIITMPYMDLALFALALFAFGLFVGYMIKIRKENAMGKY